MTQDMNARLDGLNEEVKNLGKVMLSLRYEDLKLTFCEQMGKAVEDYSRFRLRSDVASLTSCTPCPNRIECGDQLQEVIMGASKALMENRSTDAWESLNGAESMIRSTSSPCTDGTCTQNALIVLGRAKTAVELFESMKERLALPAVCPATPVRPSPQEIADLLQPLSHPKRLEILEALREGELSFSDIGRAVDLKTGHLQFHLRPLLKNGLLERGGRSYRITNKGVQALAGVGDLMGRLSME